MRFDERAPSTSRAAIRGTQPTKIATGDPRILRALELLQKSSAAHVSDIAADLNLSSSRFRHLFKQELGLSPNHYVKLTRLKQAKKLLETSFLRIKEVTALVGVNDPSHFSRDYKVLYKQTPSQTRAQTRAFTGSVRSQAAISAKK